MSVRKEIHKRMNLKQTDLWRRLRERKIVAQHKRVAAICQQLIDEYRAHPQDFGLKAKKNLGTDKVIWQYWAQGFETVPPVVRECLDSVERFAEEYHVIRLTDESVDEYLDMPQFVKEKRASYSRAHFSDLLRLMLLQVYGGVWLDATVMLSAPLPKDFTALDFFVYRRDPKEPHQNYWRNTYAYYFGWAKGFRVNMLNSILFARKDTPTIKDLCQLMLSWWKGHGSMPDYFFFQILCDVYGLPSGMPLVSDTLPHYLQQSINDPKFNLMTREEILQTIPIHKLTYK